MGTADADQRHRAVLVPDDRICPRLEQVVHGFPACADHACLVSELPIEAGADSDTNSMGVRFGLGDSAAHRDANALEGCSGSSDWTHSFLRTWGVRRNEVGAAADPSRRLFFWGSTSLL